MDRIFVTLVIAALTIGPGFADDTAVAELNNAKAAHTKELARLRDKLLTSIDAVIKAENDRGAGINYLLKERKGFEENGVTPILPKLLPATLEYQSGKSVADAKLHKVYTTAIDELKRGGKLAEAAALKRELDEIAEGKGAGPASDPAGLKTAQDNYAAALAKAKADYDATLKRATGEFRDKLKSLQAERMKAGDAAGAIKIRDVLAELDTGELAGLSGSSKSKEIAERDKFASDLSKIIWSPGRGGWSEQFTFATDGHVYVYKPTREKAEHVWAAYHNGSIVVVHIPTGVVDIFTIDLNRGIAKVYCVGTTSRPTAGWDASKAK